MKNHEDSNNLNNEEKDTTKKPAVAKNGEQGNKPEEEEKPQRTRKVRNPIEQAEYFGKQYSRTADLPDPGELLKVLATGIVQVLAGERPVDQLAKMVTEDLYLQLRDAALANIRKRMYGTAGKPKNRLQIEVRRVKLGSPRDGVIESVVLLHSDSRTRAVAIRLEGLNARWQATMVNVL